MRIRCDTARIAPRFTECAHEIPSHERWTHRDTGDIVCRMKTTLNIDETVIQRIEQQARGGQAPLAVQPPVSFQPEGYPKCVLP